MTGGALAAATPATTPRASRPASRKDRDFRRAGPFWTRPAGPPGRPRQPRRSRLALGFVGECSVTAGAVVLLFLVYLLWGTALVASQHQHAFARQLQHEWRSPSRTRQPVFHLRLGQPFAFIRIPRFGRAWRFAIVEGTGLPQLALGPGHVPGTAVPGAVGNFAVAAHRVTAGNPFYHLNDLRPGNVVLIDTSTITYVYRVTQTELVLPGDTAVLAPVPGHPGQRPHKRIITLITCDPPWTGTHRIIVFGSLSAALPRHAA